MQAMLMIWSDEASWAAMDAAQRGAAVAAYGAYAQALRDAGAMRGGERLMPVATAATVRVGANGPQVLDGPYAETKEQLGGFFLIEVADMDAALAWAARCPGAQHGVVEVRPLMTA